VKVNVNSWHYKLANLIGGDVELENQHMSLCSYFWRVVIAGLLSPILLLILVAAVVCLFIYVGFVWVRDTIKPYAIALYETWQDRHPPKKFEFPKTEPSNLLVAWMQAKKARVCPLIEWDRTSLPKRGFWTSWFGPGSEVPKSEAQKRLEEVPPRPEGEGAARDVGPGSVPPGEPAD